MTEFERAARDRRRQPGFFAELWHLARQNKKWWLLPIIFVLVLLTGLLMLSSTGAAPFIYTLF